MELYKAEDVSSLSYTKETLVKDGAPVVRLLLPLWAH